MNIKYNLSVPAETCSCVALSNSETRRFFRLESLKLYQRDKRFEKDGIMVC